MGITDFENNLLGLIVLNQDVTIEPSEIKDGIYYSRLFKKPSNHSWYQLYCYDNRQQNIFGSFGIDIRVRNGNDLPFNYWTVYSGTGYSGTNSNYLESAGYITSGTYSNLSGSYSLQNYTGTSLVLSFSGTSQISSDIYSGTITYSKPFELNNFNNIVSEDTIDFYMYRWMLQRSVLPGYGTIIDGSLFEKGTNFNTTMLPSKVDSIWNYWSLPILTKNAYMPGNTSFDYLQIRIDMRNYNYDSGASADPKIYKLVISSILNKDDQL
jgi:hypothetical protein